MSRLRLTASSPCRRGGLPEEGHRSVSTDANRKARRRGRVTYRGESPQSKDMLDDVDQALEWASVALQSQAVLSARLDTSPPARSPPPAAHCRTWRTQTAAKNARGIAKLELENAHFNVMCSKGMTTTLSVAHATQPRPVTMASPQSISFCPGSVEELFSPEAVGGAAHER